MRQKFHGKAAKTDPYTAIHRYAADRTPMSRSGWVRNYDRRRYWRERAEFLRWWNTRPPRYLLISHWLWWRERPKWVTKDLIKEVQI